MVYDKQNDIVYLKCIEFQHNYKLKMSVKSSNKKEIQAS